MDQSADGDGVSGPLRRVIHFHLAKPTPLLNTTADQHWSVRRRRNKQTAWDVRLAIGRQMPASPFARARVTIERRSVGVPDHDGLVGGCKSLVDALLPTSKVHPCGLGIITDDNPAVAEFVYRAVRVSTRAEQGTIVTIEEL